MRAISDVSKEVEKGNADYGVVPVENSIEGAVTHTMDMLIDSDLKICSQVVMSVSHHLLSNSPKEKLRRFILIPRSLPSAGSGCSRIILALNLLTPQARPRPPRPPRRKKARPVLPLSLAASVYNLKVIARNIEDSRII